MLIRQKRLRPLAIPVVVFSLHYTSILESKMASLTVKGVPEPLIAELKKEAAAHQRSLNGEVLYRLERSLSGGPAETRNFVRQADRLRHKVRIGTTKVRIGTTVDEILAGRDAGRL